MSDRAAQPDQAPATELEITPEMIRAAMKYLAFYDSRDTFPGEQKELVCDIFRAMISRRGQDARSVSATLCDV